MNERGRGGGRRGPRERGEEGGKERPAEREKRGNSGEAYALHRVLLEKGAGAPVLAVPGRVAAENLLRSYAREHAARIGLHA
eukprot:6200861-Pleurochrysis_carterae.AAC.1